MASPTSMCVFHPRRDTEYLPMRVIGCLTVLILTTALASADVNQALTGENTTIEFTGTKPSGKHTGGFKKVKGTITGKDVSDLKIEVEIDTNSLYSDDEKLTKHLKSPDFFNTKDNPTSKFVSTKITKGSTGYTITGKLTLLKETKEISFPADIKVEGGKVTITSENFKIKRMDFGMAYGKGKVDDDVTLKVSVKGSK